MKRGELNGHFSASKNTPLFPDLFRGIPILGIWFRLILSVSQSGSCQAHQLRSVPPPVPRGMGVISMRATPKIGKVTGINLVDDTTELMVISQFGKIIRIETKSIRAADWSTQGVKLLDPRTPGQSSRRFSHPSRRGQNPTRRGNASAIARKYMQFSLKAVVLFPHRHQE